MKTLLRVKDQDLTRRARSRGTDPPRPRSAALKAPAGEAASAAGSPAAARQSAQLPAFAPLMEEIEVAGWSSHRRQLSGNFHDWLLLGDGRLLVTVGKAVGVASCDPLEAALVAQAAWTAVRAHALHARDAGTLLSLAARTLWAIPAVNVHTCVAVALVDGVGGNASLAIAGDALVWRVRAATSEQLIGNQPPLGLVADASYRTHRLELALRERLLLVADEPLQRTSKLIGSIGAAFTQLDAESHRRMTAGDTVSLARHAYEGTVENTMENDCETSTSIVAVRRR